MTRLHLVRHATHGLVDKGLAGRMPGVHLSAEGELQAQGLAAYFAGASITTVLSSPLERCIETATPIAERLGLSVTPEPLLIELDCGEWTGQDFDALANDPRWHAWNNERISVCIPGGEGIEAVQRRAMDLIERLSATDEGSVLAVSHSDVIKVVILSLLQAPLGLYGRVEIEPASISTIDLWPGGGKIVTSNKTVAS